MSIYALLKRTLDILLSLIVIILLSPLLLVLAIVIRCTSPGKAIFSQERAGRNGIPFNFYKFRTMRPDADPFGPSPKTGDDPRITPIGRFLREYSLDELPQLFNILKGEMSIVGPRPLYVAQIAEWNDREKKRLLVKPGLTGLAQISGRGGLTREQKLEFDVKYVETAGIVLDFKIVFETVLHVFRRKDIYEKKYSCIEDTRGQGEGSRE